MCTFAGGSVEHMAVTRHHILITEMLSGIISSPGVLNKRIEGFCSVHNKSILDNWTTDSLQWKDFLNIPTYLLRNRTVTATTI